jgi:hypothetical protein
VSGKVEGTVVYGGGDYQLVGSPTKLDARYVISSNGDYVMVRNCGPIGSLVPWFETRADGPYAFLNANTFVSSDPGSARAGSASPSTSANDASDHHARTGDHCRRHPEKA